MEIGSGAWATSHYNPFLQINIMGASKTQEDRLKNEISNADNVIGKWYCGFSGLEHNIVFVKDGDILIAKLKFMDESEKEEVLIQKSNGRYDIKSNKHGEYYVLNSSGDLELWDTQGKFTTAKKIE